MRGEIANKAVLIYPKFTSQDTFWSMSRTIKKFLRRSEFGLPKRNFPPLGLMGLYNYLKPYYNEVVIIDRNIDPRPLDKLIKDADHIYMGGMIAQEQGFLDDAKTVKEANKILIGGGTIIDKNSPLMKFIDIAVENEAEMVMENILDDLVNKRFGTYYKGIHTPPEKFFQPDFSSINMNNYVSMAIQISRGCPWNCEFCDITARFGQKMRYTPWEFTETSIKQMYDLGWRNSIFIVDDNFIGNPSKAIETLKNLYALGENIGFHNPKYTELTITLSDDTPIMKELRKWYKLARFNSGFIGVETNNIDALRETGKFQNLRGNVPINKKLEYISKETGASIMMGMIHGFDSDNSESVDSLIDFINNTNVSTVMVGLLNALPKTKLYERLQKEGRLKGGSEGNNSDGIMGFIPYNFSAKQAEEDYLKILNGIYNEKAFFKRVMKELEFYDPIPSYEPSSWRDGVYSTVRFLTSKTVIPFIKYLPKVLGIAKRRFGFKTSDYTEILRNYVLQCAQYEHFRGISKHLKLQLKNRNYEPWQLYSWKEIQDSPIENIELLEQKLEEHSFYDRIKMTLQNGYEYIGTRLEALSHFVEPYLKKGLKGLKKPSLDNFLNIEIKAYLQAHLKKPQILGKIHLPKFEMNLRETLKKKLDYLSGMKNLFRNVRNTMTNIQS